MFMTVRCCDTIITYFYSEGKVMKREEFDKQFKECGFKLFFMEPIGEKSYSTISGMLREVENNAKFWEECKTGICSNISSRFSSLKTQLMRTISLIENDRYNWKSLYDDLNISIKEFNNRQKSSNFGISSSSDVAVEVRKLYRNNPAVADGFIKFHSGQQLTPANNNEMLGILEAYSYKCPFVAFDKITNYEIAINQVSSNYVSAIDDIENRYNDNTKSLEEHYDNLKNENASWQASKTEEIDVLIEDKNKRLKDLENLYDEKLRLQSPAKYWEELESNFKKEGKCWLIAACVMVGITVASLGYVLYNLPDSLNVTIENAGFNTIRATLILTVMISLAVYIIRLMIRMAMSAYHLSRDAKERHQLSYFYLALLRDDAIKEEDRMIVLQALFSRSDTGLIKGDSSPSFPIDSMVAQIAKNVIK